jgi:hypothetical protein
VEHPTPSTLRFTQKVTKRCRMSSGTRTVSRQRRVGVTLQTSQQILLLTNLGNQRQHLVELLSFLQTYHDFLRTNLLTLSAVAPIEFCPQLLRLTVRVTLRTTRLRKTQPNLHKKVGIPPRWR